MNTGECAELTKELWRRDGVTYRLALEAKQIAQAAWDGLKTGLKSVPQRGPEDYEREDRRPHINYGGVDRGRGNDTKLTAWILGIFGAVSTILLSLTLQAVFNLRADVSELKGRVDILVADRNRGTANGRSP